MITNNMIIIALSIILNLSPDMLISVMLIIKQTQIDNVPFKSNYKDN